MLDYVSDDNAVIISPQRRPIDRSDTAMGADPDASWPVCTSSEGRVRIAVVCRARREIGARARATIARDFSAATIARLVHSRLLEQQ